MTDRDDILIAATRLHRALCNIACQLMTDEGDSDATEAEFGLDVGEIVGMAHDGFIERARSVLNDPMVQKVFFPVKKRAP